MTDKKQMMTAAVAAHLLQNGLNGHGIRALAEAAGTSDRMLIYYFGSKDELLHDAMRLIVQGLAGQLDAAFGEGQQDADALLETLTGMFEAMEWRSMVALWFEIVGLAVRGTQPFQLIAQEIAGVFIDWIRLRLPAHQQARAADLFAHLEGRLMLRAIECQAAPKSSS
jgi:AcrR family transcriptional regulator